MNRRRNRLRGRDWPRSWRRRPPGKSPRNYRWQMGGGWKFLRSCRHDAHFPGKRKRAHVQISYLLSPLTPALSLRERENRHQPVVESELMRTFERRAPLPPLPEGEGRGEGDRGPPAKWHQEI